MRAGPEGETQYIELDDSNQFILDMFHTAGTDGQANPTPTAKHRFKAWLMQVAGVWRENEEPKWSAVIEVCKSHA